MRYPEQGERNEYDLVADIEGTSGAQRESWKGQLLELVMSYASAYADACGAVPFSVEAINAGRSELDRVLGMVFKLIPADSEQVDA